MFGAVVAGGRGPGAPAGRPTSAPCGHARPAVMRCSTPIRRPRLRTVRSRLRTPRTGPAVDMPPGSGRVTVQRGADRPAEGRRAAPDDAGEDAVSGTVVPRRLHVNERV